MESVGFFLRTAVSLAKIRFSRAGGRPYFDRLKLTDRSNSPVLSLFQRSSAVFSIEDDDVAGSIHMNELPRAYTLFSRFLSLWERVSDLFRTKRRESLRSVRLVLEGMEERVVPNGAWVGNIWNDANNNLVPRPD